jgi:pyruvate formate lyase activating enzyme
MGESTTGMIFNIQRYSIHDGPGIRTTVFLKGCPLRCWWCHNPESQRLEPESVFGKTMMVQAVMTEIEKDVLFFDESGGGVTFSGGEPLMQPEFLQALLESCKQQDIHTAIDTSGYAAPEILHAIIPLVDLVLYDLKIMDDASHRKYTGVSNHSILANLHKITESRKPVWIRFPVIPNITDTRQNVLDMITFLADRKNIQQINLLPYHRIAEGKYQTLQQEYKMAGVLPPLEDQLQALQAEFAQHGFQVKIGG